MKHQIELMSWYEILSFTLVVIVVEVAPGPNFALISKTVMTSGRLSAFANITGFAFAFVAHGSLSIWGISAIVFGSPNAVILVKLAGASYLLYVGCQSMFSSCRYIFSSSANCISAATTTTVDIVLDDNVEIPAYPGQGFTFALREGFITNCLNPKISMFYLALVPHYVTAGANSWLGSYLLVMIHVIVNAGWFVLVSLLLERFLLRPGDPRSQHILTFVSGLALFGFGSALFLSALNGLV